MNMKLRFAAWCPGYGDTEEEAVKYTAATWQGPGDVAIRRGEWLDIQSADNSAIAASGKAVRVYVRRLETGELSIWDVSGEMTPSYRAENVAPLPEKEEA